MPLVWPAIGRWRGVTFLLIVLGPAAMVASLALALNLYVDPLWLLPKIGDRPRLRYCVEDERQNKINRLVHGFLRVDSVLLGSSRSAFMDTSQFQNDRVFNLSVNGMRPAEMPEYLRIFVRHVRVPRNVYVGLDFFGFIKAGGDEAWIDKARAKERESDDVLYSVNHVFDLGVLAYAWDTLNRCSRPDFTAPTHRYDGVRYVARRPRDGASEDMFRRQLDFFKDVFAPSHGVDGKYAWYMAELKRSAPDSRFHVYLLPVTAELLAAEGRMTDYLTWVATMVAAFGKVYQFGGFNRFAEDRGNFYDSHHVYPDRTAAIVAILEGRADASADGFGEIITQETLPEYRARLPRQYSEYLSRASGGSRAARTP